MLLNNNCSIGDNNGTVLNSQIKESIGGGTKKLSLSDSNNLTLKRKRLVRQEAITQYDEKNDKKDPPSEPEETVAEETREEKCSKILALQSESTGSTETVIEAPASPSVPPTTHTLQRTTKRPDNLDIASSSSTRSSSVKRKHSSSVYGTGSTVTRDRIRKQSAPAEGGHVAGTGGKNVVQNNQQQRRKVTNNDKSHHSNGRAVSLTTG